MKPARQNGRGSRILSQTTHNPSVPQGKYRSDPHNVEDENGNGNNNGNGQSKKAASARRYYVPADDGEEWPPELSAYNRKFAETLEKIKRRHDSVVTTVGESNCLRLKSKPNHCVISSGHP